MPLVIRPPVQIDLYLALQMVPYGGGQSLLLVRDVTRQMRLEAMRKDFVANASHELRTPLTVISGYLDTLADDSVHRSGLGGPDQGHARPGAAHERHHRRPAGAVAPRVDRRRGGRAMPIDVPRMLERLHRDALVERRSAAPGAAGFGIRRTACSASAHEIESAFTNLLVNALKYTPAEGTVRMRWWTDDEGAYFSVIDSGIGIPAEHIPRLTERFYRVDAGRSRGQGGSGLGLAIVKHALQRHGGWLDVQSTEGKGSTFTCHFPQQRIWPRALRDAASA